MNFPLSDFDAEFSIRNVNWLLAFELGVDDCLSVDWVLDSFGDFLLDFAPYLIQLGFVGEFDFGSDGVIEDDDLLDAFEGGFVVVGDDVGLSELVGVGSFGSGGEECDWVDLWLH